MVAFSSVRPASALVRVFTTVAPVIVGAAGLLLAALATATVMHTMHSAMTSARNFFMIKFLL